MTCTLYAWTPMHFFAYPCLAVASAAGVNVNHVIVAPDSEMAQDAAFKAKKGTGSFPMLETEDGKIIFESVAICNYFAAKGGLMGANAFANAQVHQWNSFATGLDAHLRGVVYNVFGFAPNTAKWEEKVPQIGAALRLMNTHLNGKQFFAGNALSCADFVVFGFAQVFMSFVVGADQQALIPNVVSWYESMRVNAHVVETFGNRKMCVEALVVEGCVAKVDCSAPAQAAAVVDNADEDLDEDDLFAEDSDEAAAAEAKDLAASLRGKAFEAKKKAAAEAAGKAPLEAKSLIIYEVKPVDDETDLQALGKRILSEIVQDGLFWKTEFKTAPIAYGIEKLIIGATIIDAKVSTDDVQEKIEEMEDMVQSVDIQSFNKL